MIQVISIIVKKCRVFALRPVRFAEAVKCPKPMTKTALEMSSLPAGAACGRRALSSAPDSAAAHGRKDIDGIFRADLGLHYIFQAGYVASVDKKMDVPIQLALIVKQLCAQRREALQDEVQQGAGGDAFFDFEDHCFAANDLA